MDLTEVFEGIASAAASEQSRLRNVARSREHAQPLFAVLEKIKGAYVDSEAGNFRILEYTTWGGDIVLSAGLKEAGKGDDESTDTNWVKISGSAERRIKLFVSPDGSAAAVRWDQTKKDAGYPGGLAPVQTRVGRIAELMPVLSSWVQDNMPGSVQALTPQNGYKQLVYGRGLRMNQLK